MDQRTKCQLGVIFLCLLVAIQLWFAIEGGLGLMMAMSIGFDFGLIINLHAKLSQPQP